MFRDSVFNYFAVLGYSVEFYLFGILKEFGYYNRIFFRNFSSQLQEGLNLLAGVTNIHGSTGQYVRRTDKHREANLFDKGINFAFAGQLTPDWLIDTQVVEHSREFMTIFGPVDRKRRCSQYRYILSVQLHGQVVGDLSAHRYNNTSWRFQVDYIQDTFHGKFVEIQLVAHVVIRRNRFRVVIDHDRLIAKVTGGLCRINRTPVEFYRAADTVCTRS